jgi:hypothetical protein
MGAGVSIRGPQSRRRKLLGQVSQMASVSQITSVPWQDRHAPARRLTPQLNAGRLIQYDTISSNAARLPERQPRPHDQDE